MFKLKNLDKEITTLQGLKVESFKKGQYLTFKDALLVICETAKNLMPGESIKVFKIALKINDAKSEVELTQEEHELLKKVVSASDAFIVGIIGQIYSLLENEKSNS